MLFTHRLQPKTGGMVYKYTVYNLLSIYLTFLLFSKKLCKEIGSSHEQDNLPVQVDEESAEKPTKNAV